MKMFGLIVTFWLFNNLVLTVQSNWNLEHKFYCDLHQKSHFAIDLSDFKGNNLKENFKLHDQFGNEMAVYEGQCLNCDGFTGYCKQLFKQKRCSGCLCHSERAIGPKACYNYFNVSIFKQDHYDIAFRIEGHRQTLSCKIDEKEERLNGIVQELRFLTSVKEEIEKHKRVDTIVMKTVRNNGNNVVKHSIKRKVSTINKLEVTISQENKAMFEYTTDVKASASFFGASASVSSKFKFGFQYKKGLDYMVSEETKEEMEFDEEIEIKPYQWVNIFASITLIKDLEIPYIARLVVTGKQSIDGEDFDLSAKRISSLMGDVKTSDVVEVNDTSITFEIRGTMKASWGLKTDVEVTPINGDRNVCPPIRNSTDNTNDSNFFNCVKHCFYN